MKTTARRIEKQSILFMSCCLFIASFSSNVFGTLSLLRQPAERNANIYEKATPNPYTVRNFYADNHHDLPDWIWSYVNFHNERVIWDERRGEWKLKEGTKYLRYSCHFFKFCGGLGDRYNGMLTMFYLAMLSNRVLILESTKPYPMEDFNPSNLIHWDVKNYPKKNLVDLQAPTDDTSQPFLQDPCTLLESEHEGIDIMINNWRGEEYIWKSECMKKYWTEHAGPSVTNEIQRYANGSDIRHMYRWGFWTLFRFSDRVLKRADELRMHAGIKLAKHDKHDHQSYLEFSPYHAAHVRTGKVDTEKTFLFGLIRFTFETGHEGRFVRGDNTVHKVLKCFQGVRNETSFLAVSGGESANQMSSRKVFVASDDQKTKETMIYSDSSVAGVETGILHIDHIAPFARWNQKHYEGALDTYAEWVVLLESECLIRGASGYSEVIQRVSISNEDSRERCAILYTSCEKPQIAKAINALYWTQN